jgi:hypothetical protein
VFAVVVGSKGPQVPHHLTAIAKTAFCILGRSMQVGEGRPDRATVRLSFSFPLGFPELTGRLLKLWGVGGDLRFPVRFSFRGADEQWLLW